MDDEYFKNMVLMRHDVGGHPAAASVLESVHKALARPEGQGFTKALLSTIADVDVRSLAGLYLGHGKSYAVNVERLDAVIRRTMLGLYYHECGDRLPDSHTTTVFCSEAAVAGAIVAALQASAGPTVAVVLPSGDRSWRDRAFGR